MTAEDLTHDAPSVLVESRRLIDDVLERRDKLQSAPDYVAPDTPFWRISAGKIAVLLSWFKYMVAMATGGIIIPIISFRRATAVAVVIHAVSSETLADCWSCPGSFRKQPKAPSSSVV